VNNVCPRELSIGPCLKQSVLPKIPRGIGKKKDSRNFSEVFFRFLHFSAIFLMFLRGFFALS
jgi:hypothetical protein